MDGLRQGQRLNDLLGYRFERYLHDHRLDIWIEPVRDVIREQGTTELSNSRQKVIVDGLALLELWDGAEAYRPYSQASRMRLGALTHLPKSSLPSKRW